MTPTMRALLEEAWRLLVDLHQDDEHGLADQVGAILDGRIHEDEIELIVAERVGFVAHALERQARALQALTQASKAAQLDAIVFGVRSLLAEQQLAANTQRMVAALTEGVN